MSWKPPQYGPRGQDLNWLQCTLSCHDSFCGCNNPIKHLIEKSLNSGGVYDFKLKDLEDILKCHRSTTDDHGDAAGGEEKEPTGPDDHIDLGDLEKLFEQDTDFTEEDSG